MPAVLSQPHASEKTTSLKNLTKGLGAPLAAILTLGVVLSLGFAPSRAQAQVPLAPVLMSDSMACDAYMLNKKGDWKFKMSAERQSEKYLVWGKLIIRFEADYFAGGPGYTRGDLTIMTETKPREILYHWVLDIREKWQFETEIETASGPVRLNCHL